MPYVPNSMNQEGREAAYWQVRLVALASLVMLASNFVSLGPHVEGFAAILVSMWLLTFVFYKHFDDYFMGLVKQGAIWALAALGLWIFGQALLSIFEGFYGLGVTAAGAELSPDDATFRIPEKFNSAWLLASTCSTAFFAGFIYNHHFGKGGD